MKGAGGEEEEGGGEVENEEETLEGCWECRFWEKVLKRELKIPVLSLVVGGDSTAFTAARKTLFGTNFKLENSKTSFTKEKR